MSVGSRYQLKNNGGETGIRTLGTREGSTVFETAPFDHSGTSPSLIYNGILEERISLSKVIPTKFQLISII